MEILFQVFKSWKTSGLGLAGLLIYLAGYFGIVLDAATANSIVVVIGFLVALFSKDADKSHTQE